MAIDTNCPGCNKRLRVADDYAGRTARCPVCNTIYTIPGPDVVAAIAVGNVGDAAAAGPAANAVGSDDLWFMKTPEGRIYGPVPRLDLDRWLSEGRLTAECELRVGESGPWQSADQTYGVLRPLALQRPTASPFGQASLNPSQRPSFTAHSQARGGAFLANHRGPLILVLGILGWVFTCPILAIAAWVMGSSDLREMRSGRMDPSGMGLTQAGHVLGVIYSVIWILFATIAMFVLILAAANGGF